MPMLNGFSNTSIDAGVIVPNQNIFGCFLAREERICFEIKFMIGNEEILIFSIKIRNLYDFTISKTVWEWD